MAATSLLGGINQEASQQELLAQATFLLYSILEKMPRVDTADRLVVNPSESTSPVTISSGTVTTVSTVTSVTQVASVVNFGSASRPGDCLPLHMGNAGAMHVYNNLVFA
jgi:hypothetical protein